MRHGPDCLAADLAGRIDPEWAVRSQRLNARMSGNRCWCHCSRRPQRSRRYTGRNSPRLRHSSTRPAMLHASETAQLECRMCRGQVESGGDAAPHRPARCGHRLSHRDGHHAFDAARDGHSICAQAKRGLCSQLPYHRFTVDPDHLCTKSPIYQINKRFSLTTSPLETFLKHLNHHSRHAGILIHHQMA